jgi:hypothetical protein
MANMYNISDLTYSPSTHMEWFTKAILGGNLIEKGYISFVTGVKESTQLNKLEIADSLLQADERNCSWTPDQIFRLSDKTLEIKTYKINLEQCIDQLESKRTVWMLKAGARNTELPDTLEAATLEMLAQELSAEIETKIFAGDSENDENDFDGAYKLLTESEESIQITGAALTVANVVPELTKVYSAIPEAVLKKGLRNGTLKIFTSFAVSRLLRLALASANSQVIAPSLSLRNDSIYFLDVEVVTVNGLEGNTMIAIDYENSVLGTDLVNDFENIRIGNFPAPEDFKVFIDGRLRLGYTIPFEDEAVIYFTA